MFSSPEALIVRSTQWLHSRFTIRSTLQRTGLQFTLLAHITDTPAAFIRPFSTFLELKPLLSVLPISLCGSYSNTVLLRRCGAAGAEGGVTVDQFNRPCDGVCVSGGFTGDGYPVGSGEPAAGEIQDTGWNW